MKYNPMSEDDYDAIYWLEDKSKELPALGVAWNILRNYYEECKKELKEMNTDKTPFESPREKNSVIDLVRQVLANDQFMQEVKDFLGIGVEDLLQILEDSHPDIQKEWMLAKVARLYNMHLKLGHSARITFVAEQELENVPKGANTEILRRTVLLSALLHDVGRFYQAAHYNDLVDSHMKSAENKVGDLEVDHAIAGYYYSLASALELHKLSHEPEQEEILKYITEAVAAVVVKCHQKPNSMIGYFDYAGSSSALDDPKMIDDSYQFINDSYEKAHLMNLDVDHQMNPKHKEFINRFVDKIKAILFHKGIDYSAASGFDIESYYLDEVFDELNLDIQNLLKNMHGLSSSEVSDKIVEIMNQKLKELSAEELSNSEKEEYKQDIENSLKGMLDYDIALSMENMFQGGERIPNAVRYLVSSSMSMTMDADKIDILNQRALGIYNTSYRVNSFDIFPTENQSLREMLNQYFHFHLDSNSFVVDSKVKDVIQHMHPDVLKMIHEKLGDVDIFDSNKFPQDASINISSDKVLINGVEYPGSELYTMFQDEWISYVSRNMNLERGDFKEFKQKNYKLLPLSISREDLDSNLGDCSDEEKISAYRNLLVSNGMKQRFMLEGNNRILGGWIQDSENSEHLVNGPVSGLLWQLNQFIMVNMRNKNSYEFIENYKILDQIYDQYLEKDPLIANIIKEYIEYCKKFIHYSLNEIKEDTFTGEDLTEMRKRVYVDFGEAKGISY